MSATLLKRDSAYAVFVEHRQTTDGRLLKYILKIKTAAPDKFSEAAVCRYLWK